jgi:RHS repeat-associated protein
MQAPVVTSLTVTTPGALVYKTTRQRTATLTNSADLLSLRTLTNTTTTNGRVYTNVYDAATRTLTSTSPAGRRATIVLDAKGRPAREQSANLEPVAFTYDARGRLETITLGTGTGARVMRYAYGADGFLANITDAANRIRRYGRDASGRVIELTSPDAAQLRFGYSPNGKLTSLTPPGRPDHRFAYNENNQLSGYTAPTVDSQNTQTLATYNAERQPIRVDRPDGQSSFLQYDTAGRLSLIDIALGDIRYGYDSAGRLITLDRDQGSNLRFTYDGGFPLETNWSGPIAGSVARTYDNDSRLTSISVNGAAAIGLGYDADGLPNQVGALTLTRNAQNGLITGSSLNSVTDTTTYDTFGAPSTYTVSRGGNTIYSATLTRDVLQRIITKTETIDGVAHTAAYTYDLSGRLAEVRQDGVVTAAYTYDANGNRLSRTDSAGTTNGVYDAQDRLGQYGSTTYIHNAAGERQSQTVSAKTKTYQYDSFGDLTGVTLFGGNQIQYVLDAQGRRVGKKVNGALVQGFLYQDFLKPIAELDAGNNVVSRFVYSDGINVPAYMTKGSVTYRIVTDHLGTVRLVIDVASGSIAQRMDYDEFGKVTFDSNPGFQPFGFAGGLYDTDTSLTQYGRRYYDAESGRWTTKDPGGFSGGKNLYAYSGNDPVNFIDPFGDAPLAPHIVRTLNAMRTPYTPPTPPPPPPPAPVRPPLPTPPPAAPAPVPTPSPTGPPIYEIPVAAPATGTFIAGPSAGACFAAGTAGAAIGVGIGLYLSYELDLKDGLSDAFLPHTPGDHALEQFFENRKKRGEETAIEDLYEFAGRCSTTSLTPYCTGYSSQ